MTRREMEARLLRDRWLKTAKPMASPNSRKGKVDPDKVSNAICFAIGISMAVGMAWIMVSGIEPLKSERQSQELEEVHQERINRWLGPLEN